MKKQQWAYAMRVSFLLAVMVYLGWIVSLRYFPHLSSITSGLTSGRLSASRLIIAHKEFKALQENIVWPFIYKGRLIDSFGKPVKDKTVELTTGYFDPGENCAECMGSIYRLGMWKTDQEGFFTAIIDKDKFQIGMEKNISIEIPPSWRGWITDPRSISISKKYEGVQDVKMIAATLEGTISFDLLKNIFQNAAIAPGDIKVHVQKDEERNYTTETEIEKYKNGPEYLCLLGEDGSFKFDLPPDTYGLYLWIEPYHFMAAEFQSGYNPQALKEDILKDGYGTDIKAENDILWLNTALITIDFYDLYVQRIREYKAGQWNPNYEEIYAQHKAALQKLTDEAARQRFLIKSNRWILREIYKSCPQYKNFQRYRDEDYKEICLAKEVPLLEKERKQISITGIKITGKITGTR